jgi:hypothetical protein
MTDDLVKRLEETTGIHEDLLQEAAVELRQNRIDLEEYRRDVERLREKCDKQAMILRRLAPEKFPDTLFISGVLGKRDQNNMPEKLMVVPAYGVDFCYIYEYNGKTMGTEW